MGRYIPTAKNEQVAGFYPSRGFRPVGDGLFKLDLKERGLDTPPGIQVKVIASA